MADETPPKKNRHITIKVLLGLFIAFLLFIGIFFAIDYSHYARDKSPYRTLFIPRLELSVIQINSLTADATTLDAGILIHNPLPFNLRADSLRYEIYIRGVEVIKSSYPSSVLIKRWDTTALSFPVVAYNDKLLNVLSQAEKEGLDSVEYEIKTYLGTNLIVHKDFNLDIKTRQPLIFIPKLKLTKIEYDSLKNGGVTLYMSTEITNKNKMRLKAKDIEFRFALADDPWVKGSKPGVIDILDSGAVTPLTIPIRISFKEIGKSLGPLIKHGKNTPYKFEAKFKLVSASNTIKNSEVILLDAGEIKDIVKFAKDENKKSEDKLRAQGISKKEERQMKKDKKKERKANGDNVKFGKHHDIE